MSETISFLIGPTAAVLASLVFFWLTRRETIKTAAFVEKMQEDFHGQIEEQIRHLRAASGKARELPIVKTFAGESLTDARNAIQK